MQNTALLLAILFASNVLAQPVDLQKEAATVDARIVGKRSVTPISTVSSTSECNDSGNSIHECWRDTKRSNEVSSYKLNWASAGNCVIDNFPGCIGDDDAPVDTEQQVPKTGTERRWIDPPSTATTGFGTECSLETCDMCPTFPGCGGSEMKSGKIPALQNWAQPPVKERDEPAGEALGFRGKWEQLPRGAKREAYINPIVAGGVNVGVGPECSIHTCDMCPEHPGCENMGFGLPPMA